MSDQASPGIEPLCSDVVVTMDSPPAREIIIPEAHQRRETMRATVRGVGPTVMELSIGDRVLIDHDAGYKVTVEGEEYVVLPEDKVLAKVG